jgi:hypothetical protein
MYLFEYRELALLGETSYEVLPSSIGLPSLLLACKPESSLAVFTPSKLSSWTQKIHMTIRSKVKGMTTTQYIQKFELTDSFDVVGSVEKNGPIAKIVCR